MKMRKIALLLFLLYLINPTISYELEDEQNYFQLYPPEDKNQPHIFQIFTKEKAYTINSTEGENMNIINKTSIHDQTPIQKLSSVIATKNSFIVKTCFGPNKIVEIIDEYKNKYTPTGDYFKQLNDLNSIEYCYSTTIANIYKVGEFTIIIYWTEKTEIQGKKSYIHRCILFFPKKKSFSEIYTLDTKGKELYAQSCTNLMNKYIYCNINPSFKYSQMNHFSIIPSYESAEKIRIKFNLVAVFPTSYNVSNLIYSKPIGIFKYIYSPTGKFGYYFLTEYHDKKNNMTRLVTSLYINWDSQSFILEVEKMNKLEVYHGINIESFYISPNLFNSLLPNENEIIIIYTMKGAQGQNLLLLNRYDYNEDLKRKTELDKYSKSSFLREDICKNPKYMQSMFINSLIDYNEDEKDTIIKNKNKQFYKYQRDIATIISCDNENGEPFIEAKKIKMPQCINILNEINGINNTLIFKQNEEYITIYFDEDPNYKSLKDVYIEFEDLDQYENKIIIQGIKNDDKPKQASFKNIEGLRFSRTINFRKNKIYKIPYRIKETKHTNKSIECNLISDLCYFELRIDEESEEGGIECPYCQYMNDKICTKCEDNIRGIIPKSNQCGCQCDINKGFKLEPNITFRRCICRDGFSFYKNIDNCLPNTILNNGSFCIIDRDEETLINIYDDLQEGESIYYENELPKCKPNIPTTIVQLTETTIPYFSCDKKEWFQLGDDIFYWAKRDKCVYIIYNNLIKMYSNKIDCEYIETNYYKDCLGFDITSEEKYYSLLSESYEYNPNDGNSSLIIKKDNVTFYILNSYTEQNFSSVKLSESCIEKLKEEYRLSSILIFIAAIKKNDYITTQVEYEFYNSEPEHINEKLNLSLYCKPEEKTEIKKNKTRILSMSDEWKNHDNYTINMDEILVYVQVGWDSEQEKHIRELYIEKDINIFDSSDPFYNDVCNMYTTPKETDIYLQERKETYYIKDPLCETGCLQVGFEKEKERIICKCKTKNSTEGFENATFSSNPEDESFKKKYKLPNLKVIQCLFKLKIKFNIGQIFALLLFILYIIFSYPNFKKTSDSILSSDKQQY